MIFLTQLLYATSMFVGCLLLNIQGSSNSFGSSATNNTMVYKNISVVSQQNWAKKSQVLADSWLKGPQLSRILQSLLPDHWKDMCQARYTEISGSNFTSQKAIFVSCDLDQSSHWSLYDYRQWVSTNEDELDKNLPQGEQLRFAFEFICSHQNVTLALPWPVKAQFLWYVTVNNCTVTDYMEENDVQHNFTEPLRILELVNSMIHVNSVTFFQHLRHPWKTSKQHQCGIFHLERYVFRNCSFYFLEDDKNFESIFKDIGSENSTLSNVAQLAASDLEGNNDKTFVPLEERRMFKDIAKFSENFQKIGYKCSVSNLRYIDQSYCGSTGRHADYFMTELSTFPALEYYNKSHCSLNQIPLTFLQWRRYYPKMQYLDLSYNRIQYFTTLTDHGYDNDKMGVLDLRFNNITTLTADDLQTLRWRSISVFVDIRDNPLRCDCKLTSFVQELRNASSEIVPKLTYLKDMKCASPVEYEGMKISKLDDNFCQDLEMVLMEAPVIILSFFILILVVALVLTIKCRKEIMILAFTRLGINFPCRELVNKEDKVYDAFIAYSEQDGDWVFNVVLPRLEQPVEANGPGLRLCIHHRDFPAGGCIADNVAEKVRESHHTVLILSNNFLQSYWCKFEFRTAFAQSLQEKKRHLIMIMKEKLNNHLIDTDLLRCLKTFTYLKADDRLFWDKLIYALCDSRNGKKKRRKDEQRMVPMPENNNHQHGVHAVVNNTEQIAIHAMNNEHDHDHLKGDANNAGLIQDGVWYI